MPYVVRGLRSAGFGVLFGIALAVLFEQNPWFTLVYCVLISMICWLCIDLGRVAVARWLHSSGGGAAARDWPGWPWMFVVIVVGSAIGYGGGTALGDRITGGRSPNLLDGGNLRGSLSTLLMALIPAIALTYFFHSRRAIADREAAASTARRQAAESRLKLLESQLEPHMLFNTLANLRVLITLDPPRAQVMLDRLIAFLRATLSGSRNTQHSLRAEFDRLADYLSLVQIRMAERLRVRFELPEPLADVPVAALLLQPLVENGIKHGLEPALHGGRIEISAARDGGDLLLCVRDTGVGLGAAAGSVWSGGHPGDGGNFGLTQVRERLTTLYGARASLRLSPAPDAEGGTLAVIRLPLPA